ncbi:MAG: SH3 domain-containing protein [Bacteroidia bacterium]|nr:SH3 domain-containing protein [Bacteroidia bacterium]
MKSVFNFFFLFSFVIIFSSCEKNHLATFQDHVYEIIGISTDSLSQVSLKFENAELFYRINVDEVNVRKGPNTSYEVETTLNKDSKFLVDSVVGDWSKIKIPSYYLETTGFVSSKYIERTNERYFEPRQFIIDKVFSNAENKTDLYINYFLVLLISALIGWYIYYKKVKIEETNQLAYISWGIVMFIAGLLSVFINIETIGYNGLFAIWLILSILFTIIQLLIKVPFKSILKKYLLLPVVIFGSFILGKLVVVAIIGAIIILWLMHASNKKSGVKNFVSASPKKTKSESTSTSISSKKYLCKYCGHESSELKYLTASSCLKSPTGKHQPFEGGIQDNYICMDCGHVSSELKYLTASSCVRSPTGRHRPFKSGVQSKYSCKHCGHESSELKYLTASSCLKSPTGKHQPLE